MKHFLKFVIIVQFSLIILLVLLLTGVLNWNQVFPPQNTLLTHPSTSKLQPDNDFFTVNDEDDSFDDLYDNGSGKKSTTSIVSPRTHLKLPGADSATTIDLNRIDNPSPLTPNDIYRLEVSDDLWGYLPHTEDRIKRFKKIDPSISLVNYRDPEFKNSVLSEHLMLAPNIRIYVFLEFLEPIGSEMFYKLRSFGFSPVLHLKREHYNQKHAGVFYVASSKLKNIAKSKSIKSIYIIDNYTASVKYQLGIKSSESTDSIEFKINYPYSKPGLKISDLSHQFKGMNTFEQNDLPDRNQLIVNTPIIKNELYLFTSTHTLEVSLLKNLKRSFVVSAKDLSLEQYQEGMEDHLEIEDIFTRSGEKIVTSDYVDNILRQINTDLDLSGIWKQISFILDKDIEYDWQKRELFFSGNLPYYNIRDMYLNVKELSEKKVGACTERTSLEIAILRELGVAARSATRVYHIFTEIYVPEHGWLSTSLILNEIPLCHSYDENMAYFVEWDQEFPIRLKWTGKIIPKILQEFFNNSELARR